MATASSDEDDGKLGLPTPTLAGRRPSKDLCNLSVNCTRDEPEASNDPLVRAFQEAPHTPVTPSSPLRTRASFADSKEAYDELANRSRLKYERDLVESPVVISKEESRLLNLENLETFYNDKSRFSYFGGGVNSPQKAGDEKILRLFGDLSKKALADASLGFGVTCRKGDKGKGETHNQDNLVVCKFVGPEAGIFEEGIELLVVVDGHGEYGHHVSERVSWTLPYFMSMELGKVQSPEGVPHCIEKAFDRSHQELVHHAFENNLDLVFSGTTVIAAAIAKEHVWAATTGDSRVVLMGMPLSSEVGGPRYQVLGETQDHTVSVASEMERVIASGGRVERESQEGATLTIDRVYVGGENYPGLRLSRAFGDLCLHDLGITLHTPTVSTWHINQSGIVPILILATDGIWEFLSTGEICEKISAILALREKQKLSLAAGAAKAAHIIATQAEGAWKGFEKNYKDDICAVVRILPVS